MTSAAPILVIWGAAQGLLLLTCFGFVYTLLWPTVGSRLRAWAAAPGIFSALLFVGIALLAGIVDIDGMSLPALDGIVLIAALAALIDGRLSGVAAGVLAGLYGLWLAGVDPVIAVMLPLGGILAGICLHPAWRRAVGRARLEILLALGLILALARWATGFADPEPAAAWPAWLGATLLYPLGAILIGSVLSQLRLADQQAEAAVQELSREGAARAGAEAEAVAFRARALRQEAVADLGLKALTGASPSELMDSAVSVVARTLDVSSSVLELLPGGQAPRVRARAEAPGFGEHADVNSTTVTIQGRGHPYGVLSAETIRPRVLTSDDVYFLQAIASTLAMVIERDAVEQDRAALLLREHTARQEAESLAEVGRLINQTLNTGEVGLAIAENVLKLLTAEAAAVLWLDADSGDLRFLAVVGGGPPRRPGDVAMRRGTGLSGLAVARREAVWSRDVLTDPRLTYDPEHRERIRRSVIRSGLAVPLLAGGDVIGVLAVGARERDFDHEQIRLAQAFGNHAAAAIRNARLHETLRLRLTETETLLAVSEELAAVADLREMMRRVAREIGRALGADMVGAFLSDSGERALQPIAGYHVPKHLLHDFLTHPIPLKGHRILEEAWRTHQPVWSSDVGTDPRVHREAFGRFPHRSNLFCPMIVRGKPVGGFFVTWWEQAHEFTADEIQLVEGISRQAGIALVHAQLIEELTIHQMRLEALLEVSRELGRIQPKTSLLDRIARACAELLEADAIVVRLVEGDDLVLTSAWGEPALMSGFPPRLKMDEGVDGRAAITGRTICVTDPACPSWLLPEDRDLGYRAWMSVPIKLGERLVGVLGVRTRQAGGFTKDAVAVAEAFASQVAVSLENARLYQEVDEARNRLHLLSRRVVAGQEVERRHLARELHDEIGQVLAALKFALSADRGASMAVETNVVEVERLVHDLIERVRGMSLDLHPPMLDDLGLVPTLLWHLERYTKLTKVHVQLEHEGVASRRFKPSLEATVYRIVQEALTNVARHSGAEEATVRLWVAGDSLYVQIQDAGMGFDATQLSASERVGGLIGMQERAALLEGHLSIEASAGAGVWVTAQLPLDPDASETDP